MVLLTIIKCPRCGGNILSEKEEYQENVNYCLLCNRCFDEDLREIKPNLGFAFVRDFHLGSKIKSDYY